MDEKIIGRITCKPENNKFIAIAKGFLWTIHTTNNYKIGDYVTCSIERNNEEVTFFLKDEQLPLSNEETWLAQEKLIQ